MKRILFIHGSADLYGASKVLISIIKGLDKKNIEPIVILPYREKLNTEITAAGAKVVTGPVAVIRRQNYNLRGGLIFISDLIKSLFLIRSLDKIYKFSLIYSNTSPVLSGAIYSKLFRKKHVWHVHEIIGKPLFFRYVMPRIINFFSDICVAVSNATKQYLLLETKTKLKIKVVYNGIEGFNKDPDCTNVINRNTISVGMIGRFNRWKGQNVFVRAARKIIEGNHKLHFLIVGSYFQKEGFFLHNLRKLISESNLEEDVQIADFVEDVDKIYRDLDIVVVPSIEPEPFGLVAIEAMSLKKPVIASNIGALPEIIIDGKTGLLFEVNNDEQLKNCILKLAKDESLRKKMGEAGFRRQREFFSVDRFQKEINDIISDALHV